MAPPAANTASYAGGYHTNLRDTTSGTNRKCGADCTAAAGDALVTGLGSPISYPSAARVPRGHPGTRPSACANFLAGIRLRRYGRPGAPGQEVTCDDWHSPRVPAPLHQQMIRLPRSSRASKENAMRRIAVIVALGALLGMSAGVVTASPALAGRGPKWSIGPPTPFTSRHSTAGSRSW